MQFGLIPILINWLELVLTELQIGVHGLKIVHSDMTALLI